MAADEEAEQLFAGGTRQRLERAIRSSRARTLFSFGRWLRRQRAAPTRGRRCARRSHCSTRSVRRWSERARQELRATGEKIGPRTPDARDRLTARSFRSPSLRPRASPTARSASGCSSRTARSARTSTGSSPSSRSPRARNCATRSRPRAWTKNSRLTQAKRPSRATIRSSEAISRGVRMSEQPNIVLVHGAWADGSCWSAVIERCRRGLQRHRPAVPRDLAGGRRRPAAPGARAARTGPTIVAGHSYGGQIITALGADAPNVVGARVHRRVRARRGRVARRAARRRPADAGAGEPDRRRAGLRAGCRKTTSSATSPPTSTRPRPRCMYAVQQGLSMSTFEDVMGVPAWKSLPSWYLVAENDEAIPPDAERQFAKRMGATTVEVAVEPRRDGLAPGGGGRADRDRREVGPGRGLTRPGRSAHADDRRLRDPGNLRGQARAGPRTSRRR